MAFYQVVPLRVGLFTVVLASLRAVVAIPHALLSSPSATYSSVLVAVILVGQPKPLRRCMLGTSVRKGFFQRKFYQQ